MHSRSLRIGSNLSFCVALVMCVALMCILNAVVMVDVIFCQKKTKFNIILVTILKIAMALLCCVIMSSSSVVHAG